MISSNVDDAVSAAVSAFPVARATAPAEKRRWLVGVADALDAAADELVGIADAETALGETRLRGEVARTSGQLRMFADVVADGAYLEAVIDHADAALTPPRPDLRRVLVPIGPVAVFAASNFPFAFSVAGGDTASALAVGCPVIVKAHPGHPELSRRTAAVVGAALAAAGAPHGIFGLVAGLDEGIALVEHPGIRAVGFTGSLAGGRALFDRAAARPDPIPFFGELGSLNPVVVTAGADAARGDEIAAGLASSFQLGAGQFCTKPGIVFVPDGSRVEAAMSGGARAANPRLLTEAIASGFDRGVAQLQSVAGVRRLAGDADAATDGPASIVLALDVLTLLAHPDEILREVFGPVTVLVRYGSEDALHEALALLEGSLTATIHAAADEPVDTLVEQMSQIAGRVLFDGWPTGVAVTWAQHHGGPWPASTSAHTSVGATAVRRFQRPIAFQNAPQRALPPELRDENPRKIPRRVDGRVMRES